LLHNLDEFLFAVKLSLGLVVVQLSEPAAYLIEPEKDKEVLHRE
jgi:hypothetical protein